MIPARQGDRNGELVWTTGGDLHAQYASPIAIDAAGVRQVVTVVRGAVIGVNAQRGNLLWRYDRPAQAAANITTPVFCDGYIFNANGYGCGGGLAKIGKAAVSQVWETKDMAPRVGEVVLVDGYLYGSNDRGRVCVDFKTGKTMYKATPNHGPITYADGMLYCLDESSGTLDLVPAVPTGYKPVSSFRVPRQGTPGSGGEGFWSMPVICGGRLYVRVQNVLTAYDIERK